MEIYFRNIKTDKRYKVVGRDAAAGTITLEGQFGQFTEKYDKEVFAKNGYVLEKSETTISGEFDGTKNL